MQNRAAAERVSTPPVLVEQGSKPVAFFGSPFKVQRNEQRHRSSLRIIAMVNVIASNCAEGKLVNMATNSNKRLVLWN